MFAQYAPCPTKTKTGPQHNVLALHSKNESRLLSQDLDIIFGKFSAQLISLLSSVQNLHSKRFSVIILLLPLQPPSQIRERKPTEEKKVV